MKNRSMVSVLIVTFFLASCTPSAEPTPTLRLVPTSAPIPIRTPTLTLTLTPTPTDTPTPTLKPDAASLAYADSLWQGGHLAGAVLRYAEILQQSKDSVIRSAVFKALKGIAAEEHHQAELLYKNHSNRDEEKACQLDLVAQSAYRAILNAQDRPVFSKDPFYLDAATIEAALISCSSHQLTPTDYPSGTIESSLDLLTLYPNEPPIMEIILPPILEAYSHLIYQESGRKPQLILDKGKLIKTKAGNIQVQGMKVSDWVDFAMTQMKLCAGETAALANYGTILPKKYIFCDGSDYVGISHDPSGKNARNPAEAWFILKNETIQSPDLQCTLTYEGITYSYSYRGKYQDVWMLKNIHTLKVISQRAYSSTAPVCAFNQCSLNKERKTASCWGGEGNAPRYSDDLDQWIKDMLK